MFLSSYTLLVDTYDRDSHYEDKMYQDHLIIIIESPYPERPFLYRDGLLVVSNGIQFLSLCYKSKLRDGRSYHVAMLGQTAEPQISTEMKICVEIRNHWLNMSLNYESPCSCYSTFPYINADRFNDLKSRIVIYIQNLIMVPNMQSLNHVCSNMYILHHSLTLMQCKFTWTFRYTTLS